MQYGLVEYYLPLSWELLRAPPFSCSVLLFESAQAEGVVIGSKIITVLKNAEPSKHAAAVQEFATSITTRTMALGQTGITYSGTAKANIPAPGTIQSLHILEPQFGDFGGQYAPEALVECLDEFKKAYVTIKNNPTFWEEFHSHYQYMGRPSSFHRADRLSAQTGGASIWLKRELDNSHIRQTDHLKPAVKASSVPMNNQSLQRRITSPPINQVQKRALKQRWKHIRINIQPLLASSSSDSAMNSGLYSPVSETATATKLLPAEDDKLSCLPPPKLGAHGLSTGTFPILPMPLHTIQTSSSTRAAPTPLLAADTLSAENESWHYSEDDAQSNATTTENTLLLDKNAVGGFSASGYQPAMDALQPSSYLVSHATASHLEKRQKPHLLPKPMKYTPPKSHASAISLPKVAVDEFPGIASTSAYPTRSAFNYDAACKTTPLFKTSFSTFGLKVCQSASPAIQEAVTIHLLGICDTGSSKGQVSAGFFHGSSKLFDMVAQWFMLGFGVEMPYTSIPAHAMEELLKTHCFMNQGGPGSAATVTLKGCNSRKIGLGWRKMQELSCRLNETDSLPAFYHGSSFSMMEWLQGLAGTSDLSSVTEISSSTFSITASGKIIFSQHLSACMLKILLSILSKC
ncbi:tryptophan synthetase [Chytriomyces hyalinus]|nr:tryptophan synthetase [Chytriomyces hyalinus]